MSENKIKNVTRSLLLAYCLSALILDSAYALNLDKLKIYFLKGDYRAAISEGEKIMASYKYSPDSEELYYILGLSYLKDGNLLRASDIFEIVLGEFKDGKFREEATLGLADTFFLKGNYDKAQEYYKLLENNDAAVKLRAQVYHRLSQCAFKKGAIQEGKEYQEKLNKEFPLNFESKLDNDISVSADFYSVQVGSFGNPVNANNLCDRLIKNGYDAYILEIEDGGKKAYRVRAGRLSSRAQVVQLESKLSAEGYPTKIFP